MRSQVNAELGGLSLTWRRLLMTEKSLTDTIEDKVAMIAPTVKAIEFGGDQPFFVNCRRCSDNTWQTFVLFEQVSGLDAATADLYAAAAAVVNDTTTASQT